MSHIDWSNLEHIFKKKPDTQDLHKLLETISNKLNQIFDIDKLSVDLVISIEKNPEDKQVIEYVIQENKTKINNFLTWIFTLLLTVNSRYLKRQYASEFKKKLTQVFDYAFNLNTNKSSYDHHITRTFYFILFWILVIETSGHIPNIKNIKQKKKFAHTIGCFYNLNVDFLKEQPKLYWTYGKYDLCQKFVNNNTHSKYLYHISDLNDWSTYNNEKIVCLQIQENTNLTQLDKLINGKYFIGLNNFPVFIDEIYIISKEPPNSFCKDLKNIKIPMNSIFYFSKDEK